MKISLLALLCLTLASCNRNRQLPNVSEVRGLPSAEDMQRANKAAEKLEQRRQTEIEKELQRKRDAEIEKGTPRTECKHGAELAVASWQANGSHSSITAAPSPPSNTDRTPAPRRALH